MQPGLLGLSGGREGEWKPQIATKRVATEGLGRLHLLPCTSKECRSSWDWRVLRGVSCVAPSDVRFLKSLKNNFNSSVAHLLESAHIISVQL